MITTEVNDWILKVITFEANLTWPPLRVIQPQPADQSRWKPSPDSPALEKTRTKTPNFSADSIANLKKNMRKSMKKLYTWKLWGTHHGTTILETRFYLLGGSYCGESRISDLCKSDLATEYASFALALYIYIYHLWSILESGLLPCLIAIWAVGSDSVPQTSFPRVPSPVWRIHQLHGCKLCVCVCTHLYMYVWKIVVIWGVPKVGIPQNGWFIMEKSYLQ